MALTDDVYIPKLKVDSDGGFSIQNLNDIIRRIFQRLYALEGRTEESTIRNNANIMGSLALDGIEEPAVSSEDGAKIYFDTTLRKLQVSEDGGAFVDLVPVSVTINGTTNEITVSGGSGTFTISLPDNVAIGLPSLATGATSGFPYLPTMAGKPTGTPTAIAGFAPVVQDETDATLFQRTNSTWLGVYDRTTLSPAALTADQDDYDPGYGYVWRLSATGAIRTITGIAGHGQISGRRIIIINVGSLDIVLADRNPASQADNQLYCPGGVDFNLIGSAAVWLIYDDVLPGWRVYQL